MNDDDHLQQLNDSQPTEALVRPGLLSSTTRFVLDWLFPPRCLGCGRVDTRWCTRCTADIVRLPVQPIAQTEPLPIAATGPHTGKLRLAVHALKFDSGVHLAGPLGQRLADRLTATDWPVDLVVGVPLHPQRQAWRGYNQSDLLAEQLATRCDLPASTTALRRERATRAQVGLDRSQRQLNLQAAFVGDPAQLAGRTVLIVDDVWTTGATLAACAAAAYEGGAQAVCGLTVTVA